MMDRPDDQAERGIADGTRRLAGEAAIVIDPRLADLWQLLWTGGGEAGGDGAVALGTVAALLRLAYAQGYADAYSERLQGSLYRELGVRAPRTTPARPARRSRRG